MKTKSLEIQWKHLDIDGKTCDRCGDTGTALQRLIKKLQTCCGDRLRIKFREVRLTGRRIRESNAVTFNGIRIEDLLPGASSSENHCGSCSRLVKARVSCRTIKTPQKQHDSLSFSLLWQAAMAALDCKCPFPKH
jgi:hypothetical protein